MTDEHIRIIREAIQHVRSVEKKHFLSTSLEIALCQACRLSETRFPLVDVDFDRHRLRLLVKGRQIHYAALNPNLIPLLKRLRTEGRTHTWERKIASLTWCKFFGKLRQRHPGVFDRVSFHSTRVRGISLLERAGVPEHLVMAQVKHSSTTVHRIYRRVKPEELSPFWTALDTHGSRQTPGVSPAT
jgi:integrase